jgi:hypothetical protein
VSSRSVPLRLFSALCAKSSRARARCTAALSVTFSISLLLIFFVLGGGGGGGCSTVNILSIL